MAAKKDAIGSPMHNVFGHTLDPKGDRDDVYDHNSCPYFNKPHDVGPNTIPIVFEEGELNHTYHGSATELAGKAAISSTMSVMGKGGNK